MWIGSPSARRVSAAELSAAHAAAVADLSAGAARCGIQPVMRWMPVAYHRLVCIILGIKVRVHGQRSDVTPTLYRLQPRLLSRHRGAGRADPRAASSPRPRSRPGRSSRTLAKAQRTIFIERRSGKTSASRDEMMRPAEHRRQSHAVSRRHQQRRHARAALPQRAVRRGPAAPRRQADHRAAGGDRLHPARRHSARPLLAARCSPGSATSIWCRISGRWSASARPRRW